MLIQELRPLTFKAMVGNGIVKSALQSIVVNPKNKPVSIMLQGERGTGKTSSALIFGRAINCEKGTGDACNECKSCMSIFNGSPLYMEYDCSTSGSVAEMNKIKDTFNYSYDNKSFRVVVFDEFQLASKESQASILKVLESPPKNLFIFFCTTDPEKILETILSRSLVLEFPGLTDMDIEFLLKTSCKTKGIDLPLDIMNIIIRRVKGHARDSLSLLEKYLLVGEDSFKESTKLLDTIFVEYLYCLLDKKYDASTKLLDSILKFPVMYIEQDFDNVVKKFSSMVYIEKKLSPKFAIVIMEYLKHKTYLKDTTSWYIFFTYLVSKL